MDVTARDVARQAGVSESTVSRALAGSPVVAAATRQRIVRIAEQLGYSARLPEQRVRTVGVVVPDVANPYFAALGKAIRMRAGAHGLNAVIVDSDEDTTHERAAALQLAEHVDALVLCSPRSTDAELQALAARVPTVVTSRNVEGVPTIALDEGYSIARICSHLHALGHRRIAYLGGPPSSTSEIARSAALVDEASHRDDLEIVRLGNVPATASGGTAAADEAFASGATAVIAFNDMVALGILARARERGIRVPEDISLVGFDDVLVADTTYPALTTVAMPLAQVSSLVLDLLVRWFETAALPPNPIPAHGELVVRGSTAAARSQS